MKIKKILLNWKLLNLKLAKSKILRKNHLKEHITISNVTFRLKKVLKIIYLYHINNKKILFVGNPLIINAELLKIFRNAKHTFIPKSAWVAGSITTHSTNLLNFVFDKSASSKISHRLEKLKRKNDLVVILDETAESIALEESYSSNIPIISLNSNLNPFNYKPSYKIPGNFIFFKNKLQNNFFYSLLIATLKKSIKIKKNFNITHKLLTLSFLKKSKRAKKYFKK